MGYLIIIWLLSLFIMYWLGKRHSKSRIEEIIKLIDRMKDRDYSIPMKQDEFSILEDKIYKIFIELVEEKEKTAQNSKDQILHLEDIAHQIKTPITNMLFGIEIMQETDKESKELILLKTQVQRLSSLSDILLKLSGLDARADEMKKNEFELNELIEYALEIVEIPRRIDVFVDPSIKEKRIKGDFYWLSEAVINIIKNAVDLPRCNKIEIKAEANPLYTSLHISDNGGGIPKHEMPKIFKRFYKTPNSKGFGIGLAMAKSIIEKNNAVIDAHNLNDGAEFQIKFYNVI